MEPITFAYLQELADAKFVFELVAERRPNGQGYMLIARTRRGDCVLATNQRPGPRLFKTLDALIRQTDKLPIRNVTVIGLDPKLRSLHRSKS